MRPVPAASVTVTVSRDNARPRVSSSVIVPVALALPRALPPVGLLSVAVNVSSPSSSSSPRTFTAIIVSVDPAANPERTRLAV